MNRLPGRYSPARYASQQCSRAILRPSDADLIIRNPIQARQRNRVIERRAIRSQRGANRVVCSHGDWRSAVDKNLLNVIEAVSGQRVVYPTTVARPTCPPAVFCHVSEVTAIRSDQPQTKIPATQIASRYKNDMLAVG